MDDLTKMARRLKAIEQETTDATNFAVISRLVAEYDSILKNIRITLLAEDVPVVVDSEARKTIEQVTSKKPLPLQQRIDTFLRSRPEADTERIVWGEPTEAEWEELAQKYFYTWFSGEEYVRELIETGVLVLAFPEIPAHLREYVAEVRRCFAFQNYLAVVILCRSLMELCLRDVKRRRYISEGGDPTTPDEEISGRGLEKLIKKTIPADRDPELCQQLIDLKDKANELAHPSSQRDVGPVSLSPQLAKDFIRGIFESLHELYEKYG